MVPKDVTEQKEKQVWQRLYGKRLRRWARPRLKVAQKVRLTKKHHPFKKGYLQGWTEEMFLVRRMVPGPVPTYR